MEFAQSPYQPDILQAIEAWLATVHPDATAWFLVDGGMLEPADRKKLSQKAKVAVQAFKGSPIEAYGDYGPWLYQPPTSLRTEWVTMLRDATDGKPALSLIETNRAQGELQEFLVRLATPEIENEPQTLYCRFADARVLASIFNLLGPEQIDIFSKVIRRWSHVDRLGSLASGLTLSTSETPHTPTTFRLSSSQFSQLIEASESDNLFQQLQETSPDLVPTTPLGLFHTRLTKLRSTASQLGVVGPVEQLRFATLALMFGDDFFADPALSPTWTDIRSKKYTLSQATKNWSDHIWRALSNGRQQSASTGPCSR